MGAPLSMKKRPESGKGDPRKTSVSCRRECNLAPPSGPCYPKIAVKKQARKARTAPQTNMKNEGKKPEKKQVKKRQKVRKMGGGKEAEKKYFFGGGGPTESAPWGVPF